MRKLNASNKIGVNVGQDPNRMIRKGTAEILCVLTDVTITDSSDESSLTTIAKSMVNRRKYKMQMERKS